MLTAATGSTSIAAANRQAASTSSTAIAGAAVDCGRLARDRLAISIAVGVPAAWGASKRRQR